MRGWGGGCMAGGMHDTHPPGRSYSYGIWSMSGRYASYWNAFLLSPNLSNSLKAFRDNSNDTF